MKVLFSLLVVLALVIGIVPQFTSCEADGRLLTLEGGRQIPMKCSWTAQASIAGAVPLAALGVLGIATRRRDTRRALGVMGIILGIMVVLLPTELIGVCGSPDMPCNAIMRPVLMFTGGLAAAVSLVILLTAPADEPDALERYPIDRGPAS